MAKSRRKLPPSPRGKIVTAKDTESYIQQNIPAFHDARLASLQTLKLDRILTRKNPYLYRAKNIIVPTDFVRVLLDAHLSSQEEGIFGGFLEGLARHVCNKAYDGAKSSAEGIDMEFNKNGIRYLVTVKSGPNWANSQQRARLRDNFTRAKQVLRTNLGAKANIQAVEGCCYGKDNKDFGDYFKWCGQKFWTFISENQRLYTDIIIPLGHRAKERNEQFTEEYDRIVRVFSKEFVSDFCTPDWTINWEKIVKLNSGEAEK